MPRIRSRLKARKIRKMGVKAEKKRYRQLNLENKLRVVKAKLENVQARERKVSEEIQRLTQMRNELINSISRGKMPSFRLIKKLRAKRILTKITDLTKTKTELDKRIAKFKEKEAILIQKIIELKSTSEIIEKKIKLMQEIQQKEEELRNIGREE